ncbi:MAG: hypothetical protein VX250_02565 [Planctomycetota bacterium]|nr:hypothetical protein [Planctomycetota bacterium]
MIQNENTAPSQASWVGFLLPPLVVLAAGFLWVAASRDAPRGGTPAGTRQALKVDGVYYVYVSQVELFPTNQDNEPWDTGSTASPDIRNKVVWQGNTIYESDTSEDALIAEWSGVNEGTLDKLLGEKMIRAGQVRALKEGKLTIHVEDVDTLTPNDPAGTVELKLMDLHEGINDLSFEKTRGLGIKRILIKLVSRDQPLEAIIGKLR